MRKLSLGIMALALTIVLATSLLPILPVTAADFGPIAFGTTYESIITNQNTSDTYKIELTQPGRLTIDVTLDTMPSRISMITSNPGASIEWLDASGSTIRARLNADSTRPFPIANWSYNEHMDLEAGTYYIRVFSVNGGTGTYDLTIQDSGATRGLIIPQTLEITAAASPMNGGTVTGGGTFQLGEPVSLTATPNSGWAFEGWFEGNIRVNANATWTFTAEENRTLTAQFSQITTQPTIPNPHSDWASEELIRAFEEDLIPLSLIGSNVDLRLPISRAEFAGVAVKAYENLSGETIHPAGNNPFTDTWDIDVLRAFNAGIMVGISPTQFDPNTTLNREQAATALTRVFKRWHFEGWSFATDANFPLQFARPAPFADDAAISDWARESVYFMNANGIILGLGNNIFGPRAVTPDEQARGFAQATREQAILIALRMVENLG